MSQSLCARCLEPIPAIRSYQTRILCDNCESAWRIEFNRNMREHLARLNDGLGIACGAKRPLPIAAE